jgi:hypothetical protein
MVGTTETKCFLHSNNKFVPNLGNNQLILDAPNIIIFNKVKPNKSYVFSLILTIIISITSKGESVSNCFSNHKSHLAKKDRVDLPDESCPDGLFGERGPEALRQDDVDRAGLGIVVVRFTHLRSETICSLK